MSVVVFTGPSLAPEKAAALLPAVYLPPAAHGDLYRASLRRPKPRAIVLIDGHFQSVPAVRHKEILWALSQGTAVFGAASMGALRAAELAPYGMIGVGRVFEWFASGRLEDDDEVAIEHGPAELGHLPVSEAMVNIRATLDAAEGERAITATTRDRLVHLGKGLFYKQRSYAALRALADADGLAPSETASLWRWLPDHRIDVKAEDAAALLAAMGAHVAAGGSPGAPRFHFEHTEMWDHDMSRAAALVGGADLGALRLDHLLDELRLLSEEYRSLSDRAFSRALALREARRRRIRSSDEQSDLRHALDRDWQAANHLDDDGYRLLIREEADRRTIERLAEPLIRQRLVDELRLSGRYPGLAERAIAKDRAIAAMGGASAGQPGIPGAGSASSIGSVAWLLACKARPPRCVRRQQTPPGIDGISCTDQ